MPFWAWVLLIAGLSGLAVASIYLIAHHTHRRLPSRQVPQGDPETAISAPIPMDVAHADDRLHSSEAMSARDRELEREKQARPNVRERAATYEIVSRGAGDELADVVEDLPPAEPGVVLFHKGSFWHVDAVEPSQSPEADGRLVVSRTTDEPKTRANGRSR